jgi:predicted acylesterase/phospholipase RssA
MRLKWGRGARVAFVFSGAASRIAQEYVLMRRLVEGKAFGGEQPRAVVPALLAGSSSGALSAVALNAILVTEGLLKGAAACCSFGWKDYEELLAGLRNQDVYVGGGIIPEALEIIRCGSVFDTAPLEKLVRRVVETRMGFRVLGDLPVRTCLSVVERDTGRVYRLCSTVHRDLPLVDVLMASTAIPVAFPSWQLRLPDRDEAVACIDGGAGRDGIPVDAVMGEGCDYLFVIRPMKFEPQKPWNKNPRLSRIPIIDTAIRTLLYMQEAMLESALLRAPYYARKAAYAYLPELPYNYSFLDFDSSGQQIRETARWAEGSQGQPRLLPRLTAL